jgi:hypothetical protein
VKTSTPGWMTLVAPTSKSGLICSVLPHTVRTPSTYVYGILGLWTHTHPHTSVPLPLIALLLPQHRTLPARPPTHTTTNSSAAAPPPVLSSQLICFVLSSNPSPLLLLLLLHPSSSSTLLFLLPSHPLLSLSTHPLFVRSPRFFHHLNPHRTDHSYT